MIPKQLTDLGKTEGGMKLVEQLAKMLGMDLATRRRAVQDDLEMIAHILTETGRSEISAELEEKHVGTRAIRRLLDTTRQEQENLEAITTDAVSQLPPHGSCEPLDDDWLLTFSDHAKKVSNEDMQRVWSRVLAVEVVTPDSFSRRALRELAVFSKSDAEALRLVASRTLELDGVLCVNSEFLNPDPDPRPDLGRAESLGLISDMANQTLTVLYPGTDEWDVLANCYPGGRVLVKNKKPGRLGYRTGGLGLTDLGRQLIRLPEVQTDKGMLRSMLFHAEQMGFDARVES